MTMRIEIDRTRCDGHGLCRELLPSRIALDEWGFPIVHHPNLPGPDTPPAHGRAAVDELGDARRAAAACPSLALYLNHS